MLQLNTRQLSSSCFGRCCRRRRRFHPKHQIDYHLHALSLGADFRPSHCARDDSSLGDNLPDSFEIVSSSGQRFKSEIISANCSSSSSSSRRMITAVVVSPAAQTRIVVSSLRAEFTAPTSFVAAVAVVVVSHGNNNDIAVSSTEQKLSR